MGKTTSPVDPDKPNDGTNGLVEVLCRKVVGQPTALKHIVPYVQMHQAGLSPAGIFPVEHRLDGARILRERLAPGDWLLVKGSRSMHMEGLIDLLVEM